MGDLDRDGAPDLITAERASSRISVWQGPVHSNADSPAEYELGSKPTWLKLADVNGDRWLDLVAASEEPGAVHVLFGDGKGKFKAPKSSRTGRRRHYDALHDLNGDGRLDLLAEGDEAGVVHVLFAEGDGSFRDRGDTYRVSDQELRTVALAGVADIWEYELAFSTDDATTVVFGDTRAGLTCAERLDLPEATELVLGDVDGDGVQDAVAVQTKGTVSVVRTLLARVRRTTECPQPVSSGQ